MADQKFTSERRAQLLENCHCDISLRCDIHLKAPAMYEMLKTLSNPDYLPLNSMTEVQWSAIALRAQALLKEIDGRRND